MMLQKLLINDGALENIRSAGASFAADAVDDFIDDAIGDTPIEKLFHLALAYHARLQASEYTILRCACSKEEETALLLDPKSVAGRAPTLILRPQVDLEGGWRVDFLIHAFTYARVGKTPSYRRFVSGQRADFPRRTRENWIILHWRKLIVECDGHDFHERTKEQAAKDRSRDRWATLNKYTILRFTGSEIYKNAWGCAAQVADWAGQGLP